MWGRDIHARRNSKNNYALTCTTRKITSESNYSTRHRQQRASEKINTRGGTEQLRKRNEENRVHKRAQQFKNSEKGHCIIPTVADIKKFPQPTVFLTYYNKKNRRSLNVILLRLT